MEDARERSNRMLDEYMTALEKSFEEHKADAKKNADLEVKLETENFGGVIAEADYGADIALTVLLPEERWEDYLAHMLDITAGTVEGMVCGERFQDVPWRAPIEKEE